MFALNVQTSIVSEVPKQMNNNNDRLTAWVGRYQKKQTPTHTHPDHHASFITFLHLQLSRGEFEAVLGI